MKKTLLNSLLASSLLFASSASASIIGLDLIETGENATAAIASVFNSSDISVVSGSEVFQGAQGTGVGAQSATFSSFSFSNSSITLSMGEGFLLTSGSANTASGTTNTTNSTSIPAGSGGDADLSALASANGLSSVINDANIFSFDFTFGAGSAFNAITLDFLFATEEFPTQSVTDILGIFVDGVNYAFFPDGSLVNNSGNASNFNNNEVGTADPFGVEYNGLTDVLSVVGLVDTNRSIHTLKIAVADTTDFIFDSALFVSNLGATTTNTGGITGPTPVNAPSMFSLIALLGLVMVVRRKR